jgi:hypothetical protein
VTGGAWPRRLPLRWVLAVYAAAWAAAAAVCAASGLWAAAGVGVTAAGCGAMMAWQVAAADRADRAMRAGCPWCVRAEEAHVSRRA